MIIGRTDGRESRSWISKFHGCSRRMGSGEGIIQLRQTDWVYRSNGAFHTIGLVEYDVCGMRKDGMQWQE